MMHLIKLCVGISSVEELEEWRAQQAAFARSVGVAEPEHVHRTRMMPKRAPEIEGLGSLYWVISGAIACRQSILALREEVDHEGRKCCDIVMAPEIIRTHPRPKRPFQGWRYLKPEEAPPDIKALAEGEGDAALANELAALGLL